MFLVVGIARKWEAFVRNLITFGNWDASGKCRMLFLVYIIAQYGVGHLGFLRNKRLLRANDGDKAFLVYRLHALVVYGGDSSISVHPSQEGLVGCLRVNYMELSGRAYRPHD